jgi:hypothetical protein
MYSVARLIKELPDNYEEKCAVQRWRGVKSPADLMLLILIHLLNGTSLLETSVIAHTAKLGELSDVAFMKRLAQCKEWFISICQMLNSRNMENYQQPDWLDGKTIVAVDASDIVEKGRSRRTYRLHYALDVFKMASQAKMFNEYIVVVTSLPDSITAEQVLSVYRLRWQAEITFKRMKSILDFGDVPKKKTENSLSWLNGKLMVALLIESVIAKSFSPNEEYGDFDCAEYMA